MGGNSVAEAMETLTESERNMWAGYMREHGSLSVIHHINRGFAMLASVLVSLHGVKGATISDFMPKFAAADDENDIDEMSIDDIIASAGRAHER